MSGNIICGNIFEEMLGKIADTMVMALWTFFLLLVLIICLIVIRVRRNNERNRPPQDIEILYPGGYRKVGADSEADTEAAAPQGDAAEDAQPATEPKVNFWKKHYKIIIIVSAVALVALTAGLILRQALRTDKLVDINRAKVGNRVMFGGGGSMHEWIVLDKKDGKLLLLKKNVLIAQAYNNEMTDTTWSECSLRKWLNNDYIAQSFSDEEKKMILDTPVVNADNTRGESSTPGGDDTVDKVFLLSIDEAEQYFKNDKSRAATQSWWLRSPGNHEYTAAFVRYDGSVRVNGTAVSEGRIYIRPAMWIDPKAK